MSFASTKAHSNDEWGFPFILIGTSQKLAFTGTSARSSAFGPHTTVVRVCATADCHIINGPTPTAAADGTCMFLKAGVVEYIGVAPGDKIAAIQDSTGGNLFITEGA